MSSPDPTPKQHNPRFVTAIVALGLAVTSGAALWWSLSVPSSSSRDETPVQSPNSETEAPATQVVPSPTKDVLAGESSPTLSDSTAVTSDEPSTNERGANGEPSRPTQQPTITAFTNLETIDFAIKKPSSGAEPGPDYKEIAVTVSGPNGYTSNSIHSIEGGKEATFSVEQEDGTPLPDGLYKYEAYARTELVSGAVADGAESRATDESGRKANDPVIQELSRRPTQQVLSGTFTVVDGQIVQPDEERPQRPE